MQQQHIPFFSKVHDLDLGLKKQRGENMKKRVLLVVLLLLLLQIPIVYAQPEPPIPDKVGKHLLKDVMWSMSWGTYVGYVESDGHMQLYVFYATVDRFWEIAYYPPPGKPHWAEAP